MRKPLLEKLIQEIAMFDMDAACKLHQRKDKQNYNDSYDLDKIMIWDSEKEGFDYWSDISDRLEARSKNYHPHRDLMIELANDKTIEIEYLKDDGSWAKYDGMPLFFKFKEYRKKPKVTKKVIECRLYLTTDNEACVLQSIRRAPEDNFKQWLGDWQKVEIEVQEND